MRMSIQVFLLIAAFFAFHPCVRATKIPPLLQELPDDLARLTKECDGGNADSCTKLGLLYSEGKGVAKDDKRAVELLQRGCEAGDVDGCFGLAFRHERGRGIGKDDIPAVNTFVPSRPSETEGMRSDRKALLRMPSPLWRVRAALILRENT
ncbi:MAG: sel1 repeat family protein [Acidobacteriia bacterium]|nr:sel1 repeat family protein [Terriglobia bacterium]